MLDCIPAYLESVSSAKIVIRLGALFSAIMFCVEW